MSTNQILDELHAIREKQLADAGGTLDGLVDKLQAEEEKSKRPRFKGPPPTICPESPSDAIGTAESPTVDR